MKNMAEIFFMFSLRKFWLRLLFFVVVYYYAYVLVISLLLILDINILEFIYFHNWIREMRKLRRVNQYKGLSNFISEFLDLFSKEIGIINLIQYV